jgi:hypothetical protein
MSSCADANWLSIAPTVEDAVAMKRVFLSGCGLSEILIAQSVINSNKK